MIKLEDEKRNLAASLTRLNQRIGVEIISDSDSSAGALESDPETQSDVNTRHMQLDAEFAKNYYFITQVSPVNVINIEMEMFIFIQTFLHCCNYLCKIPFLITFQSNGVRLYLDGLVKIHPNTLAALKSANSTYPLTSPDYDCRMLRTLLKAIFKQAELKTCASMSSLKSLSRCKLKFAKDIFKERVGNDSKRLATFRDVAIEIGK